MEGAGRTPPCAFGPLRLGVGTTALGAKGRPAAAVSFESESVKKTRKILSESRSLPAIERGANGRHGNGNGKAVAVPHGRTPEQVVPFDADISEF
jgi:hypothetical protein